MQILSSNDENTILQAVPKSLYYNRPQLLSKLIQAKEEYAVWGRGTGKSDGLIADRSCHNVHSMRQSTGCFVQHTYQKLLADILPKIISGWERMGYKRDVHFFIGKRPPKKWKWNEPFKAPISYDYFIPWYTGAGIRLISQDRSGTSNGQDNDWIGGDEIKFLNKKKFEEELIPTNRGNAEHFGHLPEHHGITLATDMPIGKAGKWILDKREQMDQEQINLILAVQAKILKSKNQTEINKLQRYLMELRRDSVYYSEFSSFENIHILGIDYIKQQKRILPDLIFRSAILGERIPQIEGGFYGLFDSETHGYYAHDYSYIDSLDYNFEKLSIPDCRKDADVLKYNPLDIALDYGASINCLVVAQEDSSRDIKEYKYLNSFFTKHPDKLSDTVQHFCDYYVHYPCKDINYYFDHTAVGTDSERITAYCDIVTEVLEKNGWSVNRVYIGQAPSHHSKYLLWQYAFAGDPRLPKPRFNRENCKYPIISLEQAEVKQGKNGFEKEKKHEQNTSLPQEETTHFSDAVDTLYFGKYATDLKQHQDFYDAMFPG
jgi:hypothetical protein